jgi:hypothetical protein
MSIRGWFGNEVQYDVTTVINQKLDNLLEIYMEAVISYFGQGRFSNLQETIMVSKDNRLTKSKMLFLKWLEDKGFSQLQKIASTTDVYDTEDIIAYIDYEIYILSEELTCDDIEEIRSALISIVNDTVLKLSEDKSNDSGLWVEYIDTASPIYECLSIPEELAVQLQVPYLF